MNFYYFTYVSILIWIIKIGLFLQYFLHSITLSCILFFVFINFEQQPSLEYREFTVIILAYYNKTESLIFHIVDCNFSSIFQWFFFFFKLYFDIMVLHLLRTTAHTGENQVSSTYRSRNILFGPDIYFDVALF